MKNSNSTKASRMIVKFDKQLRDMLSEELKTVRAVKNHIIATLRNDNDDLMVA